MAPHVDWEQDPDLEPVFNPMLGTIWILAESGSGAYPPSVALHRGE
jgi:hypothetical protein